MANTFDSLIRYLYYVWFSLPTPGTINCRGNPGG